MARRRETEKLEEVRVIVANVHSCARVTEAFQSEGIAAHGDYRSDGEKALVQDAVNDRVDYIVFMSLRDLVDNISIRKKKKKVHDLIAKVYLRREGEVKVMSIGAAIKMVQQRRFMPEK